MSCGCQSISAQNPAQLVELKETLKGLGPLLILGGIGAGVILLGERLRLIGAARTVAIAGGVGLIGLGVIQFVKATGIIKPRADPPVVDPDTGEPITRFDITITAPTPGEKWSRLLPHTIQGFVTNLSNKRIGPVFITGEMLEPDGVVVTLPTIATTFDALQTQVFGWKRIDIRKSGGHRVRAVVWDFSPTASCEAAGTCHRLGDTGWIDFEGVLII